MWKFKNWNSQSIKSHLHRELVLLNLWLIEQLPTYLLLKRLLRINAHFKLPVKNSFKKHKKELCLGKICINAPYFLDPKLIIGVVFMKLKKKSYLVEKNNKKPHCTTSDSAVVSQCTLCFEIKGILPSQNIFKRICSFLLL